MTIEHHSPYWRLYTSQNDWLEFDTKEEAEQYLNEVKND